MLNNMPITVMRQAAMCAAPARGDVATSKPRQQDLYKLFSKDFYQVVRTGSKPARQDLFQRFSLEQAPLLMDDLSYFSILLAKMAHIWFPEGQTLATYIRVDGRDNPVDCWAEHNKLTHIVADPRESGFSFLLEPTDTASLKARALCFPGTAPSYKRDILCAQDHPRGVRDDVDPYYVGRAGFMHNRHAWLQQARDILDKGYDLWLVGHSLGAAYASEMMAYLSEQLPAQMERVHLLSVCPPGLRRATLEKLQPFSPSIQLIFQFWDVTPLCGAGHPAGTVFLTRDCIGTSLIPFQVPHAVPQNALRRLRKQTPRYYKICDRPTHYHRLNIAEAVRLGAGYFLWKRLQA